MPRRSVRCPRRRAAYPMIRCMSEHEVLSWARYGEAARELAGRLRGTGFTPDVVLGVARGGMVLAASLAYGLDCKNLFSVNVEFYTGRAPPSTRR